MFSGIGGLDLAVEAVFGGVTAAQVEQSEFCRGVLARHFPHADRSITDVRDLDGIAALSPPRFDVICGGFPCQDIATCGTGRGLQGDRSALFFALTAAAGRLRPTWIVLENSPVLFSRASLRLQVEAELTRIGYGSTWALVSAEAIGAPHKRLRAFVVCKRGAAHVGEVERDQPVRGYRWPTPTAGDASSSGGRSADDNKCKPGVSLTDAVRVDRPKTRNWPTPTASFNRGSPDAWLARNARNVEKHKRGDSGKTLGMAVTFESLNWSTPNASDNRTRNAAGTASAKRRAEIGKQTNLSSQVAGRLNPDFVEALMGYPIGWTRPAGPGGLRIDWNVDALPFPARRGEPQHAWEPTRTVAGRERGRPARIKALGNAVVVPQAVEALRRALAGPKQSSLWGML